MWENIASDVLNIVLIVNSIDLLNLLLLHFNVQKIQLNWTPELILSNDITLSILYDDSTAQCGSISDTCTVYDNLS